MFYLNYLCMEKVYCPAITDAVELSIKLEPIVDVQSNLAVGFEVLSMINEKTSKKEINPEAFWQSLNLNDYKFLTLTVCKRAVKIITSRGRLEANVISINIDIALIEDKDFILELTRVTQGFRLCLEINEHHKYHYLPIEQLNHILSEIKEYCSIWLDDFGSKSSNVDILLSTNFDAIKLDKQIFWKLLGDRKRLKLLVDFIISGGTKLIIEGCETEEELEIAQELGIFCQGYYFNNIKLTD